MRLTSKNYKTKIPSKDYKLIYNLLYEIEDINNSDYVKNNNKQLYINYCTDTESDNYQSYRLVFENNPTESIMLPMDLFTLDSVICALYDIFYTVI